MKSESKLRKLIREIVLNELTPDEYPGVYTVSVRYNGTTTNRPNKDKVFFSMVHAIQYATGLAKANAGTGDLIPVTVTKKHPAIGYPGPAEYIAWWSETPHIIRNILRNDPSAKSKKIKV